MLRLVLPKGSLEDVVLQLFEDADLRVLRSSSREYSATIDDPRIVEVSILRPQEIPVYVAEGRFDAGITGQDWVAERGAKVSEICELRFSKNSDRPIRIVLAVDAKSDVDSPDKLPTSLTVSAEYPNLAKEYFESKGVDAKISFSYGATEAKVPTICDAIIDNTETGSTLERNGLRIIDTLMESWTVFIANPNAMNDPVKSTMLEEIKILLEGTIRARGRVLVKLNVGPGQLEAVLALLPSMKSPTVSELARHTGFAVESVVEKSSINILIPDLKTAGATDIVELPLSKIIP